MYFNGKGNITSLGMCNLTLGSTWRWQMNAPVIVLAHTQVGDPRGSAAACWRHALGTSHLPGCRRVHWTYSFFLRFKCFITFTIFQINQINASESSSVVDLCLLLCPLLLFSLLSGFPILIHTSGHTLSGLVVASMFVSPLLDHICPSGNFCFNTVNFVNPV